MACMHVSCCAATLGLHKRRALTATPNHFGFFTPSMPICGARTLLQIDMVRIGSDLVGFSAATQSHTHAERAAAIDNDLLLPEI
jgi:hypothetical protein